MVLIDFGLSVVKPLSSSKALGYTPRSSRPRSRLPGRRTLLPGSGSFYSLGMLMLYALSGDMKAVERLDVPSSCPNVIRQFIKSPHRAGHSRARPQGDIFEQFRTYQVQRLSDVPGRA